MQKTKVKTQTAFRYSVVKIRAGDLGLVWTSDGLCRVVLPPEKKSQIVATILKNHPEATAVTRLPGWIRSLAKCLQHELEGKPASASYSKFAFDFRAVSPTHEKIYREALKISRTQNMSRQELARRAGLKTSGAIGAAIDRNPLPIIVPCHLITKTLAKSKSGIVIETRISPEPPKILGKSTEEAALHLSKRDPKLGKIIKKVGPYSHKKRPGTPFEWLLRSIIFQQLNGKAAGTIHGRVRALFGDRDPSPFELLQADNSLLAKAGLSRNKLAALKDLARAATEGEIPTRRQMSRMSDEEIIAALIPIRGIGRWTVEMLLMFGLGRADVLALDDFALKKSAMLLHGLKDMPDRKVFAELGERWRPWRTVACWYLWRALDGE